MVQTSLRRGKLAPLPSTILELSFPISRSRHRCRPAPYCTIAGRCQSDVIRDTLRSLLSQLMLFLQAVLA